MDLIILQDGLYHLYPVTKAMFEGAARPDIVDCFSLCDIIREKLTVYHSDVNKHFLKDGSVFFGCVCA
tara:strand:- start:293 stop:496 length:204 start_codon:yes stop_codon:yes gene_type:complete